MVTHSLCEHAPGGYRGLFWPQSCLINRAAGVASELTHRRSQAGNRHAPWIRIDHSRVVPTDRHHGGAAAEFARCRAWACGHHGVRHLCWSLGLPPSANWAWSSSDSVQIEVRFGPSDRPDCARHAPPPVRTNNRQCVIRTSITTRHHTTRHHTRQ